MKQKHKDMLINGLITCIFAVAASWVTSLIVLEKKIPEDSRIKLNENFSKISKSVSKIKNQDITTIFLLTKLVYNRGQWKESDFKEAGVLLEELKKNADFDFDAVQMNLKNEDVKCESFLKFYRKNKDIAKSHHYLQEKIKACVPLMEQ